MTQSAKPAKPSHFIDAVRRVAGGDVVGELDAQLKEILERVRHTGKKGSVTLKLSAEPNGNNSNAFTITADVSATAPRHNFGKSFFYTDPDGHLTRNPPEEETASLLSIDGGKKA